ncbi:MAG TPA: hypothetical protein VEI97_19390, partial [bacterium]|nr:hypothetical protein [bacterium]
MPPLVRWAPLLLAIVVTGCTAGSLPVPVPAGRLPDPGPMAEDGLPAPSGAQVRQGEQPSIKGPLALANLLRGAEVRERSGRVLELTGIGALSEGTMIAIMDPPRASVRYTSAAEPDTLLGALANKPQSSRLAPWLAQPAVQGYCYTNDALSLAYGVDRFLTSETLSKELQWQGFMEAGVITALQELFEVSIDEDFGAWWDGELLVLWLGPEGGPYEQVLVAGVRNPLIAPDKIQQILAMYYFFYHHDRAVLRDDTVAGVPVRRLTRYGGKAAEVDLAYALGRTTAAIGTAQGLELLFTPVETPAEADPEAGFVWDAALLRRQPVTAALGFRGAGEAPSVVARFLGKGVGLVPGGGTALANQLGNLFGGPGINRVLVAIEPDRFQW